MKLPPLKPIRSEEEHKAALRMVDALWKAEPGTKEGDALDALVILIEDYERQVMGEDHDPRMTPLEFLRGFMDIAGHRPSDLGDVIGSRPHASEILRGRRSLSAENIRKIAKAWHVSADLLLGVYATA